MLHLQSLFYLQFRTSFRFNGVMAEFKINNDKLNILFYIPHRYIYYLKNTKL